MTLYSASADDRETVDCFLAFQDIKEVPNVTQYPVSDWRVVGQAPQSASE